MKWAEIEIRCAPASVDAVSAALTAIGCGGTAIQDEARREGEIEDAGDASDLRSLPHSPPTSWVPAPSLPHPAAPSRVLGYLPVDDRLEGSLAELRQRLPRMASLGLEGEEGLKLRTVQDLDWGSAWKQ